MRRLCQAGHAAGMRLLAAPKARSQDWIQHGAPRTSRVRAVARASRLYLKNLAADSLMYNFPQRARAGPDTRQSRAGRTEISEQPACYTLAGVGLDSASTHVRLPTTHRDRHSAAPERRPAVVCDYTEHDAAVGGARVGPPSTGAAQYAVRRPRPCPVPSPWDNNAEIRLARTATTSIPNMSRPSRPCFSAARSSRLTTRTVRSNTGS